MGHFKQMEINCRWFYYSLELPSGTTLCFLFNYFHLCLYLPFKFSNPHAPSLVSGIFVEVLSPTNSLLNVIIILLIMNVLVGSYFDAGLEYIILWYLGFGSFWWKIWRYSDTFTIRNYHLSSTGLKLLPINYFVVLCRI